MSQGAAYEGPPPAAGSAGQPWWRRRPVVAWALYDWANSAFALSVMTSFVPVLLAGYWNDGAAANVTTFRLGLANGISSLLIAFLVPVIGAFADRSRQRKRWLVWITLGGVVLTAGLWFVGAGLWRAALALYVLASMAFAAANSLYDSLLVDVAAPEEYDRVSAYGYGLGYLGGALLFTVNVIMAGRPDLFGLAGPDEALRLSFLMVAAWWLLFSLPLAVVVRDDPGREGGPGALVAGFRELADTLGAVRRHPELWRFLLAYWLYIDGVYTIIKMAVQYGLALGLTAQDLIQAILLTNFVAFPAALAFGRLADVIGTRPGLYLALGVYILATLAAAFIESEAQFYALAVAIGLVQGGVQSLSRSFFARLIPAEHSAKYFGFYNMLGKFAAIIGPVLVGAVALWAGTEHFAIWSLLLLFVAGTWLLVSVREPASA